MKYLGLEIFNWLWNELTRYPPINNFFFISFGVLFVENFQDKIFCYCLIVFLQVNFLFFIEIVKISTHTVIYVYVHEKNSFICFIHVKSFCFIFFCLYFNIKINYIKKTRLTSNRLELFISLLLLNICQIFYIIKIFIYRYYLFILCIYIYISKYMF